MVLALSDNEQTFLSNSPTTKTLDSAEAIIQRIEHPEPEKAKLTWKDILAEEPFEGQHWEGVYGLPPGSTVERWETRSDGSTPSLSPWDSGSDLAESRPSSRLSDIPETLPPAEPHVHDEPELKSPVDPLSTYRHRQDVEGLQARQYWRPEWRSDASVDRQFNLGDASSLGEAVNDVFVKAPFANYGVAPSFHRILSSRGVLSIDGPGKEVSIDLVMAVNLDKFIHRVELPARARHGPRSPHRPARKTEYDVYLGS